MTFRHSPYRPPSRKAIAVPFALALAFCAVSSSAESVAFRFDPPAGATFQSKRIEVTEIRVGANREELTLATLSTLRLRKEASSFYIASRIDRIAATKVGKAIEVPAAVNALVGSEIVSVLRQDGALQRIDGYERLARKALPLMTGETKKSFEKYIAEGRQDDRDRASWYEMETLFGQTLELDRDYWFDAAWPDESGWIRHQTLLRLGPWVDRPEGRFLTVNLAYVRNARAEIPDATQLVPKVLSRLNVRQPGTVNDELRLDGSSTWWIDPATAVVWRLKSHRKVGEPLRVSDSLGLTLVTEEKIDVTLEPVPATPAPATQP